MMWNIPFKRSSYFFAISKIIILHFQITQLTSAEELKDIIDLGDLFNLIGNPHSMLKTGLNCINMYTSQDESKS